MPRTLKKRPAGAATGAARPALAPITKLSPQDVKRFLEGIYDLIESDAQDTAGLGSPGEAQRYTLKITLKGTKPPVWRRIEVPSSILLSELHRVVLMAMGWHGSHLHQFATVPGRGKEPRYFVADDAFAGPRATYEGTVRLDQVLRATGAKLRHDYGFADGWSHLIVLEGSAPLTDDAEVRCTAGRRACPPEDCGGPGAYARLVTWAAAPRDELTTEQVVRLRHHSPFEGWDPAAFDLTATNEALASRAWARTRRSRKPRALSA